VPSLSCGHWATGGLLNADSTQPPTSHPKWTLSQGLNFKLKASGLMAKPVFLFWSCVTLDMGQESTEFSVRRSSPDSPEPEPLWASQPPKLRTPKA
jgi:hypothetical protein